MAGADVREIMRELFSLEDLERYKQFVKEEGLPEEIEPIATGVNALWIGPRSAKTVFVYVHGGGLVKHITRAHLQQVLRIFKTIRDAGVDIAAVVVGFEPVSVSPYPSSLRSLILVLKRLLQDRTPENIHLGGDSSGAVLILALLFHAQHPHPGVPPFSVESGHLFGKSLILSPGVPYLTSTESMAKATIPGAFTVETLATDWKTITDNTEAGIEMPNAWLVPVLASESWWRELQVGELTVIYGENEPFVHDNIKIVSSLKKYHQPGISVSAIPNASHTQNLVALIFGFPDPTSYSTEIFNWARTISSSHSAA